MAEGLEAQARFASRFVRRGLNVLDLGGERAAIEAHLKPSSWDGRDVVALESETPRSNFARLELPAADLITALGVFGSVRDDKGLLRRLAKARIPVLASTPAPRSGDNVGRSAAVAAFENAATAAGFDVFWRFFQADSALYLLVPKGMDGAAVSDVGYRSAADVVTLASPDDRPALLVAGFFGRGNCGDEALFQVIYEEFSRDYDVIVSLDEHGAAEGYWNWYPYERCKRIHQGNLADPARTARAMIVGGGGLPIGFVADQVIAARSAGIPIAFAGTDLPASRFHRGPAADAALQSYIRLFNVVALRSAAAVEQARLAKRQVTYGADWALRLVTDKATDVTTNERRALVTLREFPLQVVSYQYVREVERLIGELAANGYEPTLMPFCAEDDKFAADLGLDRLAPSERHWWNSRRVKQFIASSGLMISVGRLHPTIFAATTRTPVMQICPPLVEDQDPASFAKIAAMAAELDIDYVPDIDAAMAVISGGRARPSGKIALRDGQKRLETMISTIRRAFDRG
ncbi:polysaccharide pyruvyl transferase family protein [Methylopila sp. Yamaguchi]|uniref:polysaccharide pyruvyl transferase family protein n=1 Tax=Methylopila sp. Yamaguchi TaxID=1437817 RepID=UPI000CCC4DBC|nr:polysaccharide pyruvyl transferase family protein [Methylopila sp. Yamaguchi]